MKASDVSTVFLLIGLLGAGELLILGFCILRFQRISEEIARLRRSLEALKGKGNPY
jgi:hypothetical protein